MLKPSRALSPARPIGDDALARVRARTGSPNSSGPIPSSFLFGDSWGGGWSDSGRADTSHGQTETGRTRVWAERTRRLCIIALATARPGTTIVISCAGTRDSDRLAPREWAAGCRWASSSVCLLGRRREVCWLVSSALPLAAYFWLVLLVQSVSVSVRGVASVGRNNTTAQPNPPVFAFAWPCSGGTKCRKKKPPRRKKVVVGQQIAARPWEG